MGRVMSIVGVPMLLAPVLGPVIGGAIVENLSWRWIFFVNLPVGIVGLLLARRLMPAGRAAGRAAADGHELPKLDWRGLALVSPGVGAIVFGISEYGAHRTFATPSAWLPLVLGVLAVAAFVVHALRVRYPIVDVGLFRSGGFSAAAATVFLTGIALFGSMILLPLYYQIARGESPLIAGLLVAPQGLGAALGMNLGGRATDRYGGGRVVVVGPDLPARRHGDLHAGRRHHVLLADRRRARAARHRAGRLDDAGDGRAPTPRSRATRCRARPRR